MGQYAKVHVARQSIAAPTYGRPGSRGKNSNRYRRAVYGYHIIYTDTHGRTRTWKWGITAISPASIRALVGVGKCATHFGRGANCRYDPERFQDVQQPALSSHVGVAELQQPCGDLR